eukprot:4307640-Prymnesium_polylepis.2
MVHLTTETPGCFMCVCVPILRKRWTRGPSGSRSHGHTFTPPTLRSPHRYTRPPSLQPTPTTMYCPALRDETMSHHNQ